MRIRMLIKDPRKTWQSNTKVHLGSMIKTTKDLFGLTQTTNNQTQLSNMSTRMAATSNMRIQVGLQANHYSTNLQ